MERIKKNPTIVAIQEPQIYRNLVPLAAVLLSESTVPHVGHFQESSEWIAAITVREKNNTLRVISAYSTPSKPLLAILS